MALSVFCSVLKGWWCFTETLERFSPNEGYWCQNRELGWWGKGVPPSHVEKGLLRYVVGLWAKCLPPYRLTLYFSLLSFQLQLMPQEVQRVSVPLWMIAHVRRLCIRLFIFVKSPFQTLFCLITREIIVTVSHVIATAHLPRGVLLLLLRINTK